MFVAILTDNGTVYVNVNHISMVSKGNNNSSKIYIKDGTLLNSSFSVENILFQIEQVLKGEE